MKTKNHTQKVVTSYKKQLVFFAKIATFLGILFMVFSLSPSKDTFVNQACATGWGASCTNSPGPNYHICPATGQAFSGCVQSAMFNVSIAGTRIPPGQKFSVSIAPSDGSGSVCSAVTCLRRTTGYTTDGWAGSPLSATLDQIGCATSGTCTNSFRVQVRFAQPYIDPSLNCPNPPDVIIDIQNGISKPANFNIVCDAPTHTPSPIVTKPLSPTPTLTRTPTPTVTKTPTLTPKPIVTLPPNVTATIPPAATKTPTPIVTKTPTPTLTITPTVNPVCPVPATPVVRVTCPLCSN